MTYGVETFIGVARYAALELEVPAAVRLGKLLLGHNRTYEINMSRTGAHYMTYIKDAISVIESIDRLAELPDTGYRLPMEPGSPNFAWADEEAGNVAIKNGDERLYMCLNWRHSPGNPRSPQNATVNNVARIHMTTPRRRQDSECRHVKRRWVLRPLDSQVRAISCSHESFSG